MIGGFTHYAHLRLRDHRPGNGEYQLPPEFGPDSGSSKRSILARNFMPMGGESCSLGPGAYKLQTSIGTGRSARIAPPPTYPAANAASSPAAAPLPTVTEPKQYSMALCPDTPAYSLYGRLPSEAALRSAAALPGPAAYHVPGHFDTLDPEQQRLHPTSGPVPGVHLGTRTALPGEREREGGPGPGTYDVARFADVLPRAREPLVTRRRRGVGAGATDTPGPGAYDDPTSIGHRAQQTRLRRYFTQSSTFGGRWRRREYHTTGPGPAAYNTLHGDKRLEKNQRHAPRFVRPHPPLDRHSVAEDAATRAKAGGPAAPLTFPALPSDFDFNFKKGKTIGARRRDGPVRAADTLGGNEPIDTKPSGARQFWESQPPAGGRLTAAPYDPAAHVRAAEQALANAAGADGGTPGPGAYDVAHDPTAPRAPASLFGWTLSAKFASADNGVPGPGHYRTAVDADSRGAVFYKGDFHPRGGAVGDSPGAGPGAHYNDGTAYSQSINGDRVSNKGYTMGIRYPARATYQHCAPYDETTNINCVYDDERTHEVQLPPVPGAKKTTSAW